MTFLSVFATFFGVLSALANVPQAYRIFRRKSAKDLSVWTYSIFLVSSTAWVFYGLEIGGTAIVVANAIGIVPLVAVLVGWYWYGR